MPLNRGIAELFKKERREARWTRFNLGCRSWGTNREMIGTRCQRGLEASKRYRLRKSWNLLRKRCWSQILQQGATSKSSPTKRWQFPETSSTKWCKGQGYLQACLHGVHRRRTGSPPTTPSIPKNKSTGGQRNCKPNKAMPNPSKARDHSAAAFTTTYQRIPRQTSRTARKTDKPTRDPAASQASLVHKAQAERLFKRKNI